MKKVGVVFLVLILVLSLTGLALAQTNETTDPIEKAYQCLENNVEDKCDTFPSNVQAFILLAGSHKTGLQSECKNALYDKSDNRVCWPQERCKLKETAYSLLALDYIGSNTDDTEEWLLNKNITPTDLDWYLEIDSNEYTTCKINYNNRNYTVHISEDKKIDRDAGSCLSLTSNNYWLKIESNCIENDYTVSCDQDFISTLLYKKRNSDVWHVSSETKSASANGIIEHRVVSYCFEQDNKCDYEGSLWAALALKKAGYDISGFLPYLISFAPDNEDIFPYPFLYIITDYEEYLTQIMNKQRTEGYWQLSSDRFYDTAIALMSLHGLAAEEADIAKEWLFDVQQTSGCWNNNHIRDTAFILYGGWPKTPAQASADSSIDYCSDYGYYCLTPGECDETLGNTLDNFHCDGIKVCCDKPAIQKTCNELGGIACSSGEDCSSSTLDASDTPSCCLTDCLPRESECEGYGYACKNICSETEEFKSGFDCTGDEICCGSKPDTGGSLWWIWILVILIILVILGIIFRNQVRLYMFKLKSKFKKGPVTKTRPGYPPAGAVARRPLAYARRPASRARMPARGRGIAGRPRTQTDRELEETLKKLKEIGK